MEIERGAKVMHMYIYMYLYKKERKEMIENKETKNQKMESEWGCTDSTKIEDSFCTA